MKGDMRFVELFCGIGGFRCGLERASGRFKCVWANDIDKYACQIYRKHWGEQELYEGNIETVDVNSLPKHELLCALLLLIHCQFRLINSNHVFGLILHYERGRSLQWELERFELIKTSNAISHSPHYFGLSPNSEMSGSLCRGELRCR